MRPIARLLVAACLLFPVAASAQGETAVEGLDYVRIAGGEPWQPRPGTIEVAEVFAYWCGHCAQFEPMLARWEKSLPKDVRLVRVPAAFRMQDPLARAYFAAEAIGALPRTHAATFEAIHHSGALPGRSASAEEIAAFYATLGVDATRFAEAMRAPAIDDRMTAARAFAVGTGVEGTPTLVVNGTWRVQGRTLEALLRTTERLIARERAAAAQ